MEEESHHLNIKEAQEWEDKDLYDWLTKFSMDGGRRMPPRLTNPDDKAILKNLYLSSQNMVDQHGEPKAWEGLGLSRSGVITMTRAAEDLHASWPDGRKRRAGAGEQGTAKKAKGAKNPTSADLEEKVARKYTHCWKIMYFGLTSKDFWEHINTVSCSKEDLASPDKITRLPFPYLGKSLPTDRFAISHLGAVEHSYFDFFGREQFIRLYEAVSRLKKGGSVFFKGPLGTGKSHLVAALVLCLLKEGKKVVYVPDCRQLLFDYTNTLINAFLPILYDDEQCGNDMWEAALAEDPHDLNILLKRVCNKAAFGSNFLIFIFDQTNTLDHDETSHADRHGPEIKALVRAGLDRFVSEHVKFSSATANYRAILYDCDRSTSERLLEVDASLAPKELAAFWSRNAERMKSCNRKMLNVEQKTQVEYLTGGLPILMNAWESLPVNEILDRGSQTDIFGNIPNSGFNRTGIDSPQPSPVDVDTESSDLTDNDDTSSFAPDISAADEGHQHSQQLEQIPDAAELRPQCLSTEDFANLIFAFQNSPIVAKVKTQIQAFWKARLGTLNLPDAQEYVSAMRACVHGQFLYENMGKYIDPVPPGAHKHLDHRYFSHSLDGGAVRAKASCGVAQQTAMELLRNYYPMAEAAKLFPVDIMNYVSSKDLNPASMGFVVEGIIISLFSLEGLGSRQAAIFNGLSGGHQKFPKLSKTLPSNYFQEFPPPDLMKLPDGTDAAYILIPRKFNNPATDFVLMARKGKGNASSGIIVGYQVTLAKDHSKSAEKFYRHHKQFAEWMGVKNLIFGFLWISEDMLPGKSRTGTISSAGGTGLRTQGNPKYMEIGLTLEDINDTLHKRVKEWRAMQRTA